MRIATWNLDHASNSSRPVLLQLDQIRGVNPDIIVLTETGDAVDLSKIGYWSVLPGSKNEYGKYWTTIWSKFPIREQLQTFDPTTGTCAVIDTPLGKIIVYGTILPYHNYLVGQGAKAWSAHYREIKEHGDDWAHLLANTKPRLPLIIAGDFNQTRDNSVRTYGTKLGRELLTQQLDRNKLNCITTEDFGLEGKLSTDLKKGWVRNNVDHICMTQDAFTVEYVGAWDHFTSSGQYLTDHNGVYADLAAKL